MTEWHVLLPVKGFDDAKARLGAGLSPTERRELAEGLFEHAMAVLREIEPLGVLVATNGDRVANHATRAGAGVLRDRPGDSFSQVVSRGVATLFDQGANRVLVLMADLPLLTFDDLMTLHQVAGQAQLVIAPDLVDAGTNAIVIDAHRHGLTRFGRDDSFVAHLEAARRAEISVEVVRRTGLGFDLDRVEDLVRLEDSLARSPL